MNLPFAMGLFGLAVSLVFLFTSIRELRRGQQGHALNAAKIHLGMVVMFVPFCLWILANHAP
ncbi:MAG: hypothetical protein ACK4IB_02395 [Erythrobacter sp.]|jgi:uncharacterized membrane protein